MDLKQENAMHALQELGKVFNEAMNKLEVKQENYWNSLTKEQQLDAFCAVVRRIYRGEIEENGSYRYVLYNVFGFGPEAYAPAQMAGYLAIHNQIFGEDHETRLLEQFCKTKFNMTDTEAVPIVRNFLHGV
jgi:hypothetical protein